MHFVKMEGAGNDFAIVDLWRERLGGGVGALAKVMCDRHFGVGADGILLVGPNSAADVEMRLINADGSEAEMCGNGLRCVALYAHRRGYVAGETVRVSTRAGVKTAVIVSDSGDRAEVRVDMGPPEFASGRIPILSDQPDWLDRPVSIMGREVRLSCVSMGNPHAVVFRTPGDDLDPGVYGPLIERHPLFPARTNVEFVTTGQDGLHVVVWERGAGFTLACGTGACAAVAAAVHLGLAGRRVGVSLPGGRLEVEWRADDHLYLLGPAREVFEGEWPYMGDAPMEE